MRISGIISNIICAIMVLGFAIYLIINWRSIPDTIPTHFDFSGNVDSYGSKMSILFGPGMAFFSWIIFNAVKFFPNTWNYPVKVTPQNKKALYMLTLLMLDITMPLVVFTCIFASVSCVFTLSFVFLYVVLAAMLIEMFVFIGLMLKCK